MHYSTKSDDIRIKNIFAVKKHVQDLQKTVTITASKRMISGAPKNDYYANNNMIEVFGEGRACTYLFTDLLILTHSLTFLLMPSDKHNSKTPKAKDLISSLINTASSQDVFFYQPQQLQCLHHGATFEPLCAPILSSQPRIVTICSYR